MKENPKIPSATEFFDLYEEKNPINDDLDSRSVISDITEFETMTEPDSQSLGSMASASSDSQPLQLHLSSELLQCKPLHLDIVL